MRSIKRRLVINFVFIIVITVFTLEVFMITSIRQYYYKNLESTLLNQLQTSVDLYNRYFSDVSLKENVLNNVDTFWKQSSAQVEILDMEGKVLMDSLGVIPQDVAALADVKAALEGEVGRWIGGVDYTTEKVLAVSHPLYAGERQVGVLRFVSSLREINADIRRIAYLFIGFGGLVILATGLVSILLAKTITDPLKEVTDTAVRMAGGDYRAAPSPKTYQEITRLADTLNYMAAEILKKDQLKNEFISSVSHELRTPLTSIKGWAITLKQDYEDKQLLDDGLEIIEKESDRLTDMVEELLDFSKFVSNQIVLKNTEVDINQVLEHIHKQLMPRALREQIDFELVNEPLPQFYTDENRLKQVLINLLDNSFKFTPSGGRIVLSAAKRENYLLLQVEDTGCGISPEELPKIKEKFYKGKSSKSQNGIGLSICDTIVTLMKGRLQIESQLEQGTRVTVELPLQQ